MKKNFHLDDLNQFTCSLSFFRHVFNRKLIYTEGIQYLAEHAGCYWLIDEIALVLLPKLLKRHRDWFYSIQFMVNSKKRGTITVSDGNNQIYLKRKIEYTNFPIVGKPLKFYMCESEDGYCLMLPREY